MKKLSFDEMCQLYDLIDEMNYRPYGWLPSMQDIDKYIKPDPDRYTLFCIWLTEHTDPAKLHGKQREVYDYLMECTRTNIKFKKDK